MGGGGGLGIRPSVHRLGSPHGSAARGGKELPGTCWAQAWGHRELLRPCDWIEEVRVADRGSGSKACVAGTGLRLGRCGGELGNPDLSWSASQTRFQRLWLFDCTEHVPHNRLHLLPRTSRSP